MKRKMTELNEIQLETVAGGGRYNLAQVQSLLQALGNSKGFGNVNITLNLSIIVIANSKIGGNLTITTKQT